jgi:CRISPR/Cas system-associated exonuclease Cas4 (RecB family)
VEQTTRNSRVIRASDLAQYKYCARAWWLGSVLGASSSNTREMQLGEAAHQRHGRTVWLSSWLLITAALLTLAALVTLIVLAR